MARAAFVHHCGRAARAVRFSSPTLEPRVSHRRARATAVVHDRGRGGRGAGGPFSGQPAAFFHHRGRDGRASPLLIADIGDARCTPTRTSHSRPSTIAAGPPGLSASAHPCWGRAASASTSTSCRRLRPRPRWRGAGGPSNGQPAAASTTAAVPTMLSASLRRHRSRSVHTDEHESLPPSTTGHHRGRSTVRSASVRRRWSRVFSRRRARAAAVAGRLVTRMQPAAPAAAAS